jgi:hypothetical protein
MKKMKKLKKKSIVCSKNKKQKKGRSLKKGRKKKKRPKVLSHVNRTFLILTLKLDPRPLDTLINVFLNVKKGPIQGSNWSLGFWSKDPCLK